MFRSLLTIGLSLFLFLFANSQCTTTINSFPHFQDFELDNGGWQTGGNLPSWAWGSPSKPVITSAGGGAKCWITAGLTSPGYNDGENSWVQSPCFNFSTLANPQVSFKIFWETEKQFDGAAFEYSLNGGTSWTKLGDASSNSNCKGSNWYNTNSVKYLGNSTGWSGSVGSTVGSCGSGMGSGTWLTAKHILTALAGKPSVRFRFTFGAGTTCNLYDGFAFDDFKIEEVPANPSSFTYICSSSNTVDFNSVSRICQTGTTWDFGDPASGVNNTSTLENPSHTFSAPGQYTVKLTTTFRTGPSSSTTKTIKINSVTTSVASSILCNGGTASVVATSTITGTLTYSWNSTPLQNTATATNLPAGNYTVTVTGTDVCPVNSTINITEPPAINIVLTPTNAGCSNNDGSVTATVSGGVAPYTYTWSNGSTSSSINNISAGSYTLTVKDANGCTKISSPSVVSQASSNIQINTTINPDICSSSGGSITVSPYGGTSPYSYLWVNGSTSSSIGSLPAGNYSVKVKDANGCEQTFNNLTVPAVNNTLSISSSETPASCGRNDGSASVTVSGGNSPYAYLWSNGATTSNVTALAAGNYTVTVKDINGCSSVKNITVAQAGSTLAATVTSVNASCGLANGSISLSTTGGSAPYTYLWNTGATTKDLTSLNAGTFSVTIKDALGCTFTQNNIVISQLPSTLTAAYAVINERCGGSNGSINLNVSGGNAPYTFLWNNGSTAEDLLNISAGSYSVIIKDASGCEKDFINITVTNTTSNVAINLGADRNLCPGENIVLNPGSFTSYLWQDNSTAATFRVSAAGTYYVTVKDAFGCSGSDTIKIVASTFCNVYFPAAFTPDGDNLNDNFGLLGDITSVKNYELTIYGRWGQKVFHTKNPSEKWDGTYKGKKLSSQTFVWMASFTIGSRLPQLEKGTITLIR